MDPAAAEFDVRVPETLRIAVDLPVRCPVAAQHDQPVALMLIYRCFTKLLSWMALCARSDTCDCRKVGPARPGAGSNPASCRIFQTVEAATAWPSPTSSP